MSPVVFVGHPESPHDRELGYFAVYVLHEGKIVPLLLSDHEFNRGLLRAKGRNAHLLPPRPLPGVHETAFQVKVEEVPWYRRALQFFRDLA